MKKNKKGQEFLVDIFSYLLFIMIILIFIIILVVQKNEIRQNIASVVASDYIQTRTLILLREPVKSTQKTVAESIIEAAHIERFYDKSSKPPNNAGITELRIAFNKEFGNNWHVDIYKENTPNKKISEGKDIPQKLQNTVGGIYRTTTKLTKIKLPGYESDNIIIEITVWNIESIKTTPGNKMTTPGNKI